MKRTAPGSALLLATALLVAPAPVSAQDVRPYTVTPSPVEPVPSVERDTHRPTWPLVIAGAVVAAVTYASVYVHAEQHGMVIRGQDFTDWLRVPVIGPWVAAAHHERADFEATLALVGVAQLTGLALIAAGLAIDESGDEPVVVPVATPTTAGIAVSRRF